MLRYDDTRGTCSVMVKREVYEGRPIKKVRKLVEIQEAHPSLVDWI